MAKATISTEAPAPPKKAKVIENLSLPTTPSEPVHDINQYAGVIIGDAGIGKTTLAMQEEGVLLLTCDPFQKSLRALQRHIPNWTESMGYLSLLEGEAKKGKFPYSRILIDGCDLWFRMCQKKVCERLVIDHPTDAGWGKGWDALNEEFTGAVDRFMRLPCGIWFIAHSRWKEIETRDGTKQEKLAPVLGGRAEEVLVGKSDLMINYRYDGNWRVGTIRGSQVISAKCRIDEHFKTPDGRQVTDIVMGNQGPAEAWRRVMKAFNNEQKYSTLEEFKVINEKAKSAKMAKEATPTKE